MARGNFGNRKQHQEAGRMSSGNRGRHAEHAKAGHAGGVARAKKLRGTTE